MPGPSYYGLNYISKVLRTYFKGITDLLQRYHGLLKNINQKPPFN